VYVVAHDNSTNGGSAKDLSVELQHLMPHVPVQFVHTQGSDKRRNRDLLLDYMHKGYEQQQHNQLVIAGGGDGTLHYTGEALLDPDTPSYLGRAMLTPWGLGYKNNGFNSLHARGMRRKPLALFHHPEGHVVTSNPLSFVLLTQMGQQHVWGLLYGTFGPTGPATDLLGSKAHRKMREAYPRFMHTLVDIAHAAPVVFKNATPLRTVNTRSQSGRDIVEVEFVNAEQMADGNFSRSTHLGDRAMHVAELHSSNPLAIGVFAGWIALGFPPGNRTSQAVAINYETGGVQGQVDGELIRTVDGRPAIIRSILATPAPEGKTLRYYATKNS